MGRLSAILDEDMHNYNSENDYSLLNSTTFVHIFHDKNRLTNFRRVTRGQELLYDTETSTIES